MVSCAKSISFESIAGQPSRSIVETDRHIHVKNSSAVNSGSLHSKKATEFINLVRSRRTVVMMKWVNDDRTLRLLR